MGQIARFLKISSIEYLEEFTDESEVTQASRARFLSELELKKEEVRERLAAGETGLNPSLAFNGRF